MSGVIHSSNLCTEITLNTSNDETAVCNLGSVILDSHLLPDGGIDHRKLRETVRMAVRALDNVIDINFYPTEAAKRSNQRHRPIGLGLMGLANALYIKGVAFASDGGRGVQRRGHGGRGALRLRGELRPGRRAGGLLLLPGFQVGPGPAAPGHPGSPRSRARRAGGRAAGRPDGLDGPARQDRSPGHAQQQRARHRPHGDDLEHHGDLALHRADLQEPLREVEPLGRVHRAEPVPGEGPEGRAGCGTRT